MEKTDLERIRHELDELDQELIRILARRFEIGREAAQAKRELGVAIHDPSREEKVIAQARQWAREAGLPENEINELFQRMIRISRNSQISSFK